MQQQHQSILGYRSGRYLKLALVVCAGTPFLIGVIKDITKSTDSGLHMLAGLLVLGAVLVLVLAKPAAASRGNR